jgi:glycerol-3-phosphate O-acyltransferase / dihydroxyacetone phosphate acyltransferase
MFPGQRILNYWSKGQYHHQSPDMFSHHRPASLFGNPILKYILLSTGNIPVARKSKDRRVLFKGTFDALAAGWAVALFPEGTSYTEPRIMQVKDGAAWAALEYTKWAHENPDKAGKKPVKILPAAIVYTNKSKYRSDVSDF